MKKIISILAISGALMGVSLISLAEETPTPSTSAPEVNGQKIVREQSINTPRELRKDKSSKKIRRNTRRSRTS